MMTQNAGRIIIASADFAVIDAVQNALRSAGYALACAYSHGDALHTVQHGRFDVGFIDARMGDRHSGDATLSAIRDRLPTLPLIGYAPNGTPVAQVRASADVMLASLHPQAILDHIAIVWQESAALTTPLADEPVGTVQSDDSTRLEREVETLFDLSRSLTEVLDLSTVLNRVVEAARRLTDAEEGMILLPDEVDASQLILRAKVGIDLDEARNFRVKTQDTLAGHVFKTGQPVLIGEQGPQKVKTAYFVNSLLYVPIALKGSTIGVLGVNNKITRAAFSGRDQELLLNLASFAAIAIENARIHQSWVDQAHALQRLVESSHSINASVSLDDTLARVCEQLASMLHITWAEIYQWDADGRRLHTWARNYRSVWRPDARPTFDLARSPAVQRAFAGHEPVLDIVHDLEGAAKVAMQRQGAQVILTLPLFNRDYLVGAVQVFYIHAPKKPVERHTITLVQAAVLERLAALADTARRTELLHDLIDEVKRLSAGDWCVLMRYAAEDNTLIVEAAGGDGIWLKAPRPYLDLRAFPELRETMEAHRSINQHLGAENISRGGQMLLDATGSTAILVLPLVQRGALRGVVLLGDSQGSRPFSRQEIDTAQAVVAQAATALENARLFYDLAASMQELKDTQDRLVQTARLSAMGELAAAVAHQINNPLTTILVDTEMLLLDEPEGGPQHRALTAIYRAGKRASGVARRLLAIARPTDESEQPELIDVVETIEGVLSLVKSHIERDGIRIITRMPPERLPPVMAVSGQLDDIWLNLLLNAHDALIGRENATIQIDVAGETPDDCIHVAVRDNGPGIPDEILDRIFEPFFTTKPVGQGTGLGLHICRQTVERVGGSVSVESAYNKGTQFYIRLPLKKGGD